jgi:hypothetical protein
VASGRRPPVKKTTTQQIQADAEGVASEGEVVGEGAKVELTVVADNGTKTTVGTYRMADRIGLMPLLRFANASKRGIDSSDMEGMAALYDMIRDCIDVAEWPRFQQDATDAKAEDEDLLRVVSEVIEVLTARKAAQRSGSSRGSRKTSEKSKALSSSPDTPPRREPPTDGLVSVAELARGR